MFKNFTSLLGFSPNKTWRRQLENRNAHPVSLLILVIIGLLGYNGVSFVGILALMLGVTMFEFVKRMDQGLPLLHVAALIAVLQWVVGAWLTYNVDLFFSTYDMRVDSDTYFSYAIPGTAAYLLGLLGVGGALRQRGLLWKVDRSHFLQLGMILALLGFAGGLAAELFPGGLAYVFFLISQLRYVAALYFIFSRHRLRWVFTAFTVLPLFTGTAATGMFHDLLLWMGILVCYVYAMQKRRLWVTTLILIIGISAGFTIQGIKRSYRDKVWNKEEGSLVKEIKIFWEDPHAMFGEENLSNSIIRMNQGWIIAAIMQNVPSSEPFAWGETVKEAVMASLLPRVISEDKANSGGQAEFRRFTGLPIGDTTAMGLSLLGEAYVNFGKLLGIVVMFGFGTLISIPYSLCLRFSIRHPDFYFWMPIIFCSVIKAESNLVTTLNSLSKGSLLVFGLYWIISMRLFPATGIHLKAARIRQPHRIRELKIR